MRNFKRAVISLTVIGVFWVLSEGYNEHQAKLEAEIAANIEKHGKNYWYKPHLAGE